MSSLQFASLAEHYLVGIPRTDFLVTKVPCSIYCECHESVTIQEPKWASSVCDIRLRNAHWSMHIIAVSPDCRCLHPRLEHVKSDYEERTYRQV